MKRLALMLVAGMAIAMPAAAKDIAITFTDQERSSFAVMLVVYDQCIAGAIMRNDFTSCKNLHAFLSSVATKIGDAQREVAPTPAPTPPPPTE